LTADRAVCDLGVAWNGIPDFAEDKIAAGVGVDVQVESGPTGAAADSCRLAGPSAN